MRTFPATGLPLRPNNLYWALASINQESPWETKSANETGNISIVVGRDRKIEFKSRGANAEP
jgi:hypothetical protein